MSAMERYAILLIDHGSRRDEANAMLSQVATLVRQRIDDRWPVEIAHMELAEPNIQQGFSQCVESGATTVIVHPFMLAPGRHAREDIPRLVADAAQAHPEVKFIVSAPLGAHGGLAEAVVDRCMAEAPDLIGAHKPGNKP